MPASPSPLLLPLSGCRCCPVRWRVHPPRHQPAQRRADRTARLPVALASSSGRAPEGAAISRSRSVLARVGMYPHISQTSIACAAISRWRTAAAAAFAASTPHAPRARPRPYQPCAQPAERHPPPPSPGRSPSSAPRPHSQHPPCPISRRFSGKDSAPEQHSRSAYKYTLIRHGTQGLWSKKLPKECRSRSLARHRPKGLTDHEALRHQYLKDRNATGAAIRAGYSPKTAQDRVPDCYQCHGEAFVDERAEKIRGED